MAPKIAVPGVSRPRTADQPPQTRSCPSGHSGSSRSVSSEAGAGQQADPVAERAVVLDVRHPPGGVVHLDVRRPVPVGLARHQPALAGVVGEHPPRRVGDREREPAARSQHPGDLGDGDVDVADELQRAEGREDHVEASRRRTAGAVAVPSTDGHAQPGLLVDPPGVLQLPVGQVEPDRATALRADPSRALAGAGARPRARRGPATSPRTPALSSLSPSGPHTKPDVAEELAVRGLVLVGVAVPVRPVGPPGLGLVDRAALDAHRGMGPGLFRRPRSGDYFATGHTGPDLSRMS